MMARIAQLVECTLRIDRFCCAVERPAGGLQLPCVSFAELGLLRCRVAYGTLQAPVHLASRTPAVLDAELGLLRCRVAFGTLGALMPLAPRTPAMSDAKLGLPRRRVVLGTLGAAGHLALPTTRSRPLPLPPRLLPRRRPRIPPPPSAPAPSRSSNLTSLIRRASHSLDSAPAGTTLNDSTSIGAPLPLAALLPPPDGQPDVLDGPAHLLEQRDVLRELRLEDPRHRAHQGTSAQQVLLTPHQHLHGHDERADAFRAGRPGRPRVQLDHDRQRTRHPRHLNVSPAAVSGSYRDDAKRKKEEKNVPPRRPAGSPSSR